MRANLGAVGTQTTWNFEYLNKTSSDLGKLLTDGNSSEPLNENKLLRSPQLITTEFQGSFNGTVIKVERSFTIVCFTFDIAKLVINGVNVFGKLHNSNDSESNYLNNPVYLKFDSNCRIISIQYTTSTPRSIRDLFRTLLSQLQYPCYQKESFQQIETDNLGTYIALYTLVNNDRNQNIWLKTKSSYTLQQSAKSIYKKSIQSVNNSRITMQNGSSQLLSISGNDSNIIFANGKPVGTSLSRYLFKYKSKSQLDTSGISVIEYQFNIGSTLTEPLALFEGASQKELKTSLARKRLGNSSYDSIFSKIRSVENNEKLFKSESSKLSTVLAALLYLYPSYSDTVYNEAIRMPPSYFRRVIIQTALVEAGDTIAQLYLFKLLENIDFKSKQDLQQFIILLFSIQNPSLDFIKSLQNFGEHYKGLSNQMDLLLGNYVSKLLKFNKERANQLFEYLNTKLTKILPANRIQRILVFGNTEHPNALPYLLECLQDTLPEIRNTTLNNLHSFDDLSIKKNVSEILLRDVDSTVRTSALQLLVEWNYVQEDLELFKKVSTTDLSIGIRLKAIKAMWDYRDKYPEILQFLLEIGKNDTNEEVRNTSFELLQSIPK